MAYTQISDIVEPSAFAEYTIQKSLEKNLLLQSGIAISDPIIKAKATNSGGRTVYLPRWASLPSGASYGSTPATDDTTELSAYKLGTDEDMAYKNLRSVAFAYPSVIETISGSDPAAAIANGIADWDATDNANLGLNILSGLFSTSGVLASSHVNDISTQTGADVSASNLISDTAIQDARFLLGDRFDDLAGIIMHSTIYKALENLDLIDYVAPSVQHARPIPYYHGMRVLIDDAMTQTAITTPSSDYGYTYDTFLFGRGAFSFEFLPNPVTSPMFEVYKEPLKGSGAGMVTLIYRKHFILHPRGVKFSGSIAGDYPTNTEYATVGNWTKVYDDKEIKIVKLRTNG